jgi:apolipoprotein N-acyltransferase
LTERTRGLAAAFQPQPLARLVAAFAAGGALNLAFAPVACWPIGVLAPAALFALIRGVPPRRAGRIGAAFGAGLFAFGTYWLYTCLHTYGLVPVWLTLVLQTVLVGLMSAYPAALCFGLFIAPMAVARHDWTRVVGPEVPVAAVQGAVSQDQKWQRKNREATMIRYSSLTDRAWGARLIVWPESALPVLANNLQDYLHELQAEGRRHGVTNTAWYGDSTAPHQHLQISCMRALEAGRYLIRATNDGITAAVGPHGQILARLPQFAEGVLRVEVQPMTGLTPYARAGNYPVVLGATALLGLGFRRRRGA